jgi:hypothetical protein
VRTALLERGPDVRRAALLIVIAGAPLVFLRPLHAPINPPKLALLFVGVSLFAAGL